MDRMHDGKQKEALALFPSPPLVRSSAQQSQGGEMSLGRLHASAGRIAVLQDCHHHTASFATKPSRARRGGNEME